MKPTNGVLAWGVDLVSPLGFESDVTGGFEQVEDVELGVGLVVRSFVLVFVVVMFSTQQGVEIDSPNVRSPNCLTAYHHSRILLGSNFSCSGSSFFT